jgi:hypothetical protein
MIVPEDIPMEDAKTLVIDWHEEHYSATKMYTKLLIRAGEACPAYSTITNWIRALTGGEDIRGYASGGGRLPDEKVDTMVINALEKSSFHSLCSLASTIKIPPTTVWRHFHARGYVVRSLHIVPRMLSLAQNAAPVESAIELKKMLCSAKHYGWRDILTGDELWFYFTINPDHRWVPERVVTPTPSSKQSATHNECSPFSGPRSLFPSFKLFQKDMF